MMIRILSSLTYHYIPNIYNDQQWLIQDFPEVGAPTLGGQHTILPNFPHNCMKLKEFGPGEGGGQGAPRQ